MNNTNTGGPAFPTTEVAMMRSLQGMTLRDYFAAKAMQGLLVATVTPITVWSQDDVAETAYNMADSMLKAREA